MIEGTTAIRDAYRDENVARTYVDVRFREPLGALLHARQARALRRLIQKSRPARVLEIAPGPARLTVDVAPVFTGAGCVIDASRDMLAEARRRLEPVAGSRWGFLNGDVFQLPFREAFDLVYMFRLLRHFDDGDRARIYREVARVIRPGGLLAFDAINRRAAAPLRANAKPGEFQHYDALLEAEDLEREVSEGGFDVVSLEGVQRHYLTLHRLQVLLGPRSRPLARAMMELVDRAGGRPLEWIVACRRR